MKILIIAILLILPVISLAQFDLDLNNLFFNEYISSNISIRSVDLIWSADSYTPYNYAGRALPAPGSKVVIEVMVDASGNANDLKYSWFLENVFQKSKSGYGKTRFYFYAMKNPGSSYTIKLQIFNENRSIFEEKTIEIPIVEPELIIESNNSIGQEFSFSAKPYFFSINKLTDLTFEWLVPGQDPIISSDYDASVLNITISGKENNEILESVLRVNAQNNKDPRQEASQIINVLIY